MLLALAFARAYVTYGALPQVEWLFYGIQPVVVAIVAQVIWNPGRTVFKGAVAIVIALLVLVLYLLNVNVLILLCLCYSAAFQTRFGLAYFRRGYDRAVVLHPGEIRSLIQVDRDDGMTGDRGVLPSNNLQVVKPKQICLLSGGEGRRLNCLHFGLCVQPAFFLTFVNTRKRAGGKVESAPDCANARKGLVFFICYCVCL